MRLLQISFLVILFCFISCKSSSYQTYQGEVFGSTFSIIYKSNQNLNREVDSIFNDFNQTFSTYQKNSEINKFNSSKNGVNNASTLFFTLFSLSQEMHHESNGFFDPSVAPLVNLYGFGENGIKEAPTQNQIDSVLAFVGFDKIHIKSPNHIRKENIKTEVNFNSVTGFCNDLVADLFDHYLIEDYLIEIGGEIRAKGRNRSGHFWTVGIDDPTVELSNRKIVKTIRLNNESLATSGNYRKFYIDSISGKTYAHNMNPITGNSEPSDLLSVSVIHENCSKADALSTAILAMGFEKAHQFLMQNSSLKTILYTKDQNELKESLYGF